MSYDRYDLDALAEPIPAGLYADPATGTVPVGSPSQAMSWMAYSLRDVPLNQTEQLLMTEGVFLRLGQQGAAAALIAVLIERVRGVERETVLKEVAPEVTANEKVASMRAAERARFEAQTAAQLATLRNELEAAHKAELDRLRTAWDTVNDVLVTPH